MGFFYYDQSEILRSSTFRLYLLSDHDPVFPCPPRIKESSRQEHLLVVSVFKRVSRETQFLLQRTSVDTETPDSSNPSVPRHLLS